MNKRKGISLIVLVITILVMIILAGVVVVSLSKNSPIEKSKEAEFKSNLSAFNESLGIGASAKLGEGVLKENMDAATYEDIKEYISMFKKDYVGKIEIEDGILIYVGSDDKERKWADEIGIGRRKDKITKPKVTSGLTPIKYVNGVEEVTNINDNMWYDYDDKLWANAKTKDGSYYVWVPRFAYKITYYDKKVIDNKPNGKVIGYSDARGYVDASGNPSYNFSRSNGVIDVVLLGNGINKYSYIKNGKYFGNTSIVDSKENPENYIVHPAFSSVRRTGYNKENLPGNFGAKEELDGFWIAKFEMSAGAKSIPDVVTEREKSMNEIFNMARGIKVEGLDAMNLTNTQFSAATYLTIAKGKMPDYNDNTSFNAGGKNYIVNSNLSSTKNVTGIYDLNGCAWEYVSAFLYNNNENLNLNMKSLLDNKDTKYVDVYRVNDTDDSNLNYEKNKDKYGDAIYEISTSGIYATNNSWYGAKSSFPMQHIPAMGRGGTAYIYSDGYPGLFTFGSHYGKGEVFMGWRAVLI